MDHVRLVDHWPTQETLALILASESHGGGSGHNAGMNIRRLDPGMPVATVGLLGDDDDGRFLLERAREAGIDCRELRSTSTASSSFTEVYTERDNGRRTFFHHRGASDLLEPSHFDFRDTRARILHLGLLGLHALLDRRAPDAEDANGWVTVFRRARAAGLLTSIELVSIEPERIREIALPCLPWLDFLIVNDFEIGALTGIDTVVEGRTDVQACQQAVARALALGEQLQCVVAHYPDGAILQRRDTPPMVSPSLEVDRSMIVGSVGAGDAFAAGMLYGLHEDWDDTQSLDLAHAAAALSLRSASAVDAVLSVEECLALWEDRQ